MSYNKGITILEAIMQTNELQNLINTINRTLAVEQQIEELETKVAQLESIIGEQSLSKTWVSLGEAAKNVGLTTPALRSRIKRYHYPENIVWKQKSPKSTIFINLVELGEHL